MRPGKMDESRHVRLPQSSRIGDKVMEYYLKYGKERKLEKFMRFHSPTGSTRSTATTTTTSSSSSNEDWTKMGDLRCLFIEEEPRAGERRVSGKSPNVSPTKKERIVPIEIEIRSDEKDHHINLPFGSPKTPDRSKEGVKNVLESQTPESTRKSHKRLEWDSLADVGYKKSKSTSNISIVERMLLREFYEVTSNAPKNTNSSESDIRLLEQEIAELGNLKKHFIKSTSTMEETNYGTPPLASSTHLEKKRKPKKESKGQGAGTRSSILHEKFENVAEISARKEPETTSILQEKIEKSAQTSPKKKTKANAVGTSTSTLQEKLEKSAQTSVLGEPKVESTWDKKLEKSAQTSVRKEPKANAVGTSTSTLREKHEKSAQTSLRGAEMTSQGVQVTLKPLTFSSTLGSSAEPSSFEYHPKLSTHSDAIKSSQSSRPKAGESHPFANEISGIFSNERAIEIKSDSKESELCDRIKELFVSWNKIYEENKENTSSPSSNSTISSNPHIDLGIQLICGIMRAKTIQQRRKKRLVRSIVKRITKIASSYELDAIVRRTADLIDGTTDDERIIEDKQMHQRAGKHATERDVRPSTSKKLEDHKTHQPTESKSKMRTTPKPISAKEKSVTQSEKIVTVQKYGKQNYENVSATTTEPQTSISTRNSTSKSVSPKSPPAPNAQLKCDTTTLELGLTKKASKASLSSSSNDNCGDQAQYLDISLCVTQTPSGGKVISAMITQPETSTNTPSTLPSSSSTGDVPTQKEATKHPPISAAEDKGAMEEWLNPMTQSEVEFEDKKRSLGAVRKESRQPSSTRSEKEGELKWINSEIERLQNLKKVLLNDSKSSGVEKSPREYSPTTQDSEKLYDTVYSDNSQKEKRSNSTDKKSTLSKKDQNGNIKETRTSKSSDTSPKRSSKSKSRQKAGTEREPSQRSKIDTPLGTTGTESVESFVRQRKQEFLDHYKNQKLYHYDKIMNKYNECPRTSREASGAASHYSADENSDGPYSAPAQLQFPQPTSYYTYPPPTQQGRDSSSYYKQALAPATTTAKRISSNITAKTPATASSELSVPMGSYNSSTSTTTHQYDLAISGGTAKNKADTGSQTGHSLVRSKPIYETRCLSPIAQMVVPCTCTDVVRSTAVQVRPTGVTYAIVFPKKLTNAKYDDDNSEISSDAIEEYQTLDKAPSLQKALVHGNPHFLNQVKKRKSILNRIQKLRQERKRKLREIADENMSINSLDRKLVRMPPQEQIRLFPTKQMKAMTNKRVAKLPEVLASQEQEREQRFKRGNRLLREVYNRRLRDRVRGGNLNLNHSFTLI